MKVCAQASVKQVAFVSKCRSRPFGARGACVARAEEATPAPAQSEDMKAAYAKAMEDPEVRNMVEQQMQSPEVQAQVQQMASVMANPQLQERMRALQADPEFASMFKEIEQGGMSALMKYWDDPVMLKKLAAKLGDVPLGGAPATPPPPPDVNDLFDASKFGDLEAAEDLVAVGKDVNMQDAEKRTPLHYAAAHDHPHIIKFLLEKGANLELADAKNNTPLHYAAGYGRVDIVEILLDAGANTAAENATGKTPAAVARLNPQNPVLGIQEIISRLEPVSA